MEEYKILMENAYKEAKLADYMAYVTSKLVKDKKILISVLDHVNKSFTYSIKAYLMKERMYRRVPPLPSDNKSLIEMFFDESAKGLNVEKSLKFLMLKVNNAIKAYNDRGMLLERTNKYVFVAGNYKLIDFKVKDVKDLLKKNIDFVNVLKREVTR